MCVLGLSLISKKNSASTSKELEKMFIQYGIPGAIWSDNGGEKHTHTHSVCSIL